MEAVRLDPRQFLMMTIHFTIGTSILIGPAPLAVEVKQDAWLACILGCIWNVLLVVLYNWIAGRYPGLSPSLYIERILGKWPGRLVSLWLLGYLMLLTAFMLKVIGTFFTTQMMPETPIEPVQILWVVIMVIGVRLGLGTFSRASELLMPWVFILFAVLVLPLAPRLHLNYLMPVFESKPGQMLYASFHFLTLQEHIVLLYIFPYVTSIGRAKQALFSGSVIGSLFLIIIAICSIMVLGANLTQTNLYPTYALAKTISVGRFLQRIEAVMAVLWMFTIFIKVCVTFFALCDGVAQMLRLRSHHSITLPMGVLAAVLSFLVHRNIFEFLSFTPTIWPVYASVSAIVIPLLLAGVELIRNGRRSPQQPAGNPEQTGGEQTQGQGVPRTQHT